MTAYVTAACRSPVAPRGGALSALSLNDLGAPVIQSLLEQATINPEDVDEIIVSTALGPGGNPARSIALAAGLPERVAGLSIDRQCAGGLDALLLARALVAAGMAQVVVAGGVESYSRRPLRLRTYPDGRPPEAYDQAPFTPWPTRDPDMADAAAALAHKLGIGRAAQDNWAISSHAMALAHVPSEGEILPFPGINADAFTRRLSPALCARAAVISGNITAANAAVAADGAGFCLVVSEAVAKRSTTPVLEISAGATLGGAPEEPGLAPVAAIARALEQARLRPADLSVAEIMEAYAVQAIACVEASGLDPAIVNPGGGALARGHPIGASGAINAVRLYHEISRRGGRGLAAIAAAGGIGTALVLAGP